MTSEPRRTGAAVGFRRNIKWFLATLVGFLITVILVLLLFLQTAVNTAIQEEAVSRRNALTAARQAIDAAGPDAPPVILDGRLVSLRGSLPISRIELRRTNGQVLSSGTPFTTGPAMSAPTANGTITLYFAESEVESLEDLFHSIALIVLLSTAAAGILLVMMLPRIVRPIDRMLEDARQLGDRDEAEAEDRYLVETFRKSIETLRKQEEELRRLHDFEKTRADDLERITSTLTRSISSGFIALDAGGKVVDLNRAARDILQLSPDESPPGTIEQVLSPGEIASTLATVFHERKILTRQELFDPKRKITLGLTTVPLYDVNDRFLGMLVLFTDLTGMRELEQRMREMQALADLGEVSAGIAHEIRNALGTILGYLKLARRQGEREEAEGKIRLAESEGRRLSESISALLAFARPVSLESEPVELRDLIGRVASRVLDGHGEIAFRLEGRAEIEGDDTLLETVFENLIRNSREAIESVGTGSIEVSLELGEGTARAVIRDDGPGIAEQILPRVFLPFQTGKASGTGLGLALAKKIVLLHGGSITIEPRREGGTEVSIRLPVRQSVQ